MNCTEQNLTDVGYHIVVQFSPSQQESFETDVPAGFGNSVFYVVILDALFLCYWKIVGIFMFRIATLCITDLTILVKT